MKTLTCLAILTAPLSVYGQDASEPNETGPLLNGERHGLWIERNADGTVIETPYVNGVIHGTKIERNTEGRRE